MKCGKRNSTCRAPGATGDAYTLLSIPTLLAIPSLLRTYRCDEILRSIVRVAQSSSTRTERNDGEADTRRETGLIVGGTQGGIPPL